MHVLVRNEFREVKIEKCDVCRTFDKQQQKETLVPHEVPDRPWAKVAVDLLSFKGRNYMHVCVDYYPSFLEMDALESIRSATVIRKLKLHFARHGIPETVISDNGPQFTVHEFQDISRQ